MDGKELTGDERAVGIRRLADRLGITNPNMICDILLWKMAGQHHLDPTLLEQWLVKTGKYHPEMCDESLRECMIRVYGKECADLAESLI